jgi:hypothetical protein
MKYKKELANSYSSDGWDSYIEQGSVTTTGERQSEYVLYIDFMRFSIVEDLSATDGLPVTIKIARTTRQPRSRNESNADPSRR